MACRIVGAGVLQRATLAGDNDHGEDHGDKLAETHLCIGDLRISVRQSVGSSYCPRPLKTMRRRSGRKCIEMAKWFESARGGTESAREGIESAREGTESARERY